MDTLTTLPDDTITKEAADAVVEFALTAFEPQYLCWNAPTNTALAAYAWNTGDPRATILAQGHAFDDPRMHRLYERLCEMRRTRFGGIAVTVWDLVAAAEDGEMVFYFRLSWDGGDTCRPCRVVVDPSCFLDGAPPGWN